MVTFLREYMGKEKGFALNIRVKPFYIVKVSSSVSRSLIRFNR